MALPSIFAPEITEGIINRINKLSPETQALWGKMNVAQMLAHCCVSYAYVYDNTYPKPGAFKRFLLKSLIKNAVVSEKPYKKNSPTSPDFKIVSSREFELEKNRLIDFIKRSQQDGVGFYDGKESHSFGVLTVTEWNNMFYKHLDHHLSQFGV